MLTPNRRAVASRWCIRAVRPTDTTTSGGWSEPDMKALAVIACGRRRGPAVMTMTPVAKRPSAFRNARSSTSPALPRGEATEASVTRARAAAAVRGRRSAERAGTLGIDEVLGRPALQVVLRHARLGELLPAIVLPGGERPEQRVAPDLLVASGVVDLVQLVAAAELAADRIPQELHQLDASHRVDAPRPAQVEVKILAQVRRPEVLRVRVEVDEPARHGLLDEVL